MKIRAYESDNYDEALEYLVSILSSGDTIRIKIDSSTYDSIKSNNIQINDFVHRMITQLLKNVYGVNVPQMANFVKVQKFVENKVYDRLINYISLVGIDGKIISYTPNSFVTPYIIKRVNLTNQPITNWNSSVHWDFEQDVEGEMALANPLNGYLYSFLELNGIDNYEFKRRLVFDGLIKESDLDSSTLIIKILPCDNFNKILNLMHAIFKYY